MRLYIKAKPSAPCESVEKIDETHYIVAVTEPPVQGRANRAIIAALANHFNVSTSHVNIVSGHTSRQKVMEIM